MSLINVWQLKAEPFTFVWDLKTGWNFDDYKNALSKFNSLIEQNELLLANQTITIITYIADSSEPHHIIEMAWYGFKNFQLDYDTNVIVVGPRKRWQSLLSIYNYIHGSTKNHFTFVEEYDLAQQVE